MVRVTLVMCVYLHSVSISYVTVVCTGSGPVEEEDDSFETSGESPTAARYRATVGQLPTTLKSSNSSVDDASLSNSLEAPGGAVVMHSEQVNEEYLQGNVCA
jgi:hypothetical protein